MEQVTVDTVEIPNGETIGYRRRRGGEVPVVLLHSNITSSAHWDILLEHLDSRYALYAMDMRGFGNSSYRAPISSLDELAADVALFLDEMGLESTHVVGWSTGGAVGMCFAADHPERVDRLALIAPVPTRDYYPAYELDENGEPTETPVMSYEKIARHPDVRAVADAQERGDAEFMKDLWRDIAYTENEPDSERFDRYGEDMCTQRNYVDVEYAIAHFDISDGKSDVTDGTGAAENITSPTLVLRGERDLIITDEMARVTAADIGANATFRELPNCGHSPLVDDPATLTAELTRFLEGAEP